ncbi:ATP-binding protein [Streptomyces sp. YIM S03343]
MIELTDAGTLIVSELMSNAVQHTSCRLVRVSVRRLGHDAVRIGVSDGSRTLPKTSIADETDESGRGLVLVDALSYRWGCDRKRWGKIVWAELMVQCIDAATAERNEPSGR